MNTPQTSGSHIPEGEKESAPFTFNFNPEASAQFAQVLGSSSAPGEETYEEEDDEYGEEGDPSGDMAALAALMGGMMGGGGAGMEGGMGAMLGMLNPEMMAQLQEKFEGLVGLSSGLLEDAPIEVLRRVRAVKKIQRDRIAIEAEYDREVRVLDAKYAEKYAQLEAKQTSIITGAYEPVDDDLVSEEGDEHEDGEEEGENGDGPSNGKDEASPEEGEDDGEKEEVVGLPRYWLNILSNHPEVSELIQTEDEAVLESLINVHVSYPEDVDATGFDLTFEFGDNEYIAESKIVKSYRMVVDEYRGPVFDSVFASPITFAEGKDVRERADENVSFFNFFTPPVMPSEEEADALEEEDLEELQQALMDDFEIGETIRTIVPRAPGWFTGDAVRVLRGMEMMEDGGDPFMGFPGMGGFPAYDEDYEYDEEGNHVTVLDNLDNYNSDDDEDYVPGQEPPPADCTQQ